MIFFQLLLAGLHDNFGTEYYLYPGLNNSLKYMLRNLKRDLNFYEKRINADVDETSNKIQHQQRSASSDSDKHGKPAESQATNKTLVKLDVVSKMPMAKDIIYVNLSEDSDNPYNVDDNF